MEEKEITAVNWIANELYEKMEMKGDGNVFDKILEKANEIFEKQIIEAYESGAFENYQVYKGEDYYNEKFKK